MITQRTSEQKVMRDPVHDYIHIDYQVIWDVINTKEFQRLRRIHQMGTSYLVYHTAEHSRFSHSLGVYEIVRRMTTEVEDLNTQLTESEKIQVMLAGLCHDLGHGPFSHFFELVIEESHEKLTERILIEESDVHRVLEKAEPGLSHRVASILNHTHPKTVLTQLISSQLDADRMDYLLRDAFFTGTSYGTFDLGRILRTLRMVNNRLAIKHSGIHSIEDYIMARYHMYWQVYFHPTSRAVEALLLAFFRRLKERMNEDSQFIDQYPMFLFMKKGSLNLEDHYRLDESTCFYGFQCMQEDHDLVLSDLSKRILERRLFNDEDVVDEEQLKSIQTKLVQHGFDPQYYFYQDKTEKRPYSPYNEENSLIYILENDGSVVELSQSSKLVHAIVHGEQKQNHKVFYPKEITS